MKEKGEQGRKRRGRKLFRETKARRKSGEKEEGWKKKRRRETADKHTDRLGCSIVCSEEGRILSVPKQFEDFLIMIFVFFCVVINGSLG